MGPSRIRNVYYIVSQRNRNYCTTGCGINFMCQKSAFYLIMVTFLSGVKDNVTVFNSHISGGERRHQLHFRVKFLNAIAQCTDHFFRLLSWNFDLPTSSVS